MDNNVNEGKLTLHTFADLKEAYETWSAEGVPDDTLLQSRLVLRIEEKQVAGYSKIVISTGILL